MIYVEVPIHIINCFSFLSFTVLFPSQLTSRVFELATHLQLLYKVCCDDLSCITLRNINRFVIKLITTCVNNVENNVFVDNRLNIPITLKLNIIFRH